MGADPDESTRDPLADAVRAVIRTTRTTQVGGAERDRAIALLAEAQRILEADVYPGPHCQVGWAPEAATNGDTAGALSHFEANPLPHQFFPYSPVVGPKNPIAPPLQMTIDDDRTVRATLTLDEQYNGPPWNIVHGGVIALLFDELLGVATIVKGVAGFTGRLTVHYRKPTPILEPIELRAWVESVSGRKVIAKGEIRVVASGEVSAEADGLFIQTAGPIREADVVADAVADAPSTAG